MIASHRTLLPRQVVKAAVLMAAVGALVALMGARPAAADASQPGDLILITAPDLRVSETKFVTIVGDTFLRITVKNSGTGNAGPYQVAVKQPALGPIGGQVFEWFIDVNGLGAGAVEVFYHKLPACLPYGLVSRQIEVDATQVVAELNEGNNTATASFFYGPSCA